MKKYGQNKEKYKLNNEKEIKLRNKIDKEISTILQMIEDRENFIKISKQRQKLDKLLRIYLQKN